MQKDYRTKLSSVEFNMIQVNVDKDNPIDDYYEKLIVKNDKLRQTRGEFPRGYEDINLIRQLTKGQQLLILLGIFDGQVKNGGSLSFSGTIQFTFSTSEMQSSMSVLPNFCRIMRKPCKA